jgi:Mu-like prophage protein Com.
MEIRCKHCGKLLAKVEGKADIEIQCSRCKQVHTYNIKATDIDKKEIKELMKSRSYKRVKGAIREMR